MMSKKTRLRHVFAIVLAVVLVAALSVPVFAAGPSTRAGIYFPEGTYRLEIWDFSHDSNGEGSGFFLNIDGSGQVSPHRNVNIYRGTGSNDQLWNYKLGADGNYRFHSMTDQNYALNLNQPLAATVTCNCDILAWRGNEKDSALYYFMGSDDWTHAAGEIEAAYYNFELAVGELKSQSNVVWLKDTASAAGYNMIWL